MLQASVAWEQRPNILSSLSITRNGTRHSRRALFCATLEDRDGIYLGRKGMRCGWDQDGARLVRRLENPGPLDLLAMDRTVSRAEVHSTDLGKRITAAKRRVAGAVTRASKLLADLEITRAELLDMVEARIRTRLQEDRPGLA